MTGADVSFRYVRANGVQIHFAEAGDPKAPLVILLHGFPEFWFAWRDYLSALAASGFYVVAPDQRGYNLSEKPRQIEAYRLSVLADDVAALATVLGHPTFHLVGHDWGGAVAWALASSASGQRIARMVILNAAHPKLWVEAMTHDLEQRQKSRYVRFLRLPILPEWLLRRGHFRGLMKPLLDACPREFTSDVSRAYQQAWQKPGALSGMLNWYRALNPSSVPRLDATAISTPALLLWGERDPYAVATLAKESARLCVHADEVYFPKAGHWIHHEERARVLSYLDSFLNAA